MRENNVKVANEYLKKIDELIREAKLFGSAYVGDCELRPCVCIEIDGDWKHEHLRLDWLIKENFEVLFNNSTVLDDTGCDWYNAVHRFWF